MDIPIMVTKLKYAEYLAFIKESEGRGRLSKLFCEKYSIFDPDLAIFDSPDLCREGVTVYLDDDERTKNIILARYIHWEEV